MRLARLAAVGLAIGLIAGFVLALLRTRPRIASTSAIHEDRPPLEEPGDRRSVAAGTSARVLELGTRRVGG